MQKLSRLLATLFFVGYAPFAPGTLASLLGAGLYLLIRNNTFFYLTLTVVLLVLGFWASGRAEKSFRRKDPPQIVIDEFSSVLLVYMFVPFSVKFLIMGLVFFRIFDIFKITPVKKLQALPAGWGIMLDDIAAAIFANILLQVIRVFPLPI